MMMMMMRCIVSIPSPRERARPGKHLSRYFFLTNPFNAVSVFVALFFSYFVSFFVLISFPYKSIHSSILLFVLKTPAIQSNAPYNCFVCTVFAQDCSDISFCRDHSMPQLCLYLAKYYFPTSIVFCICLKMKMSAIVANIVFVLFRLLYCCLSAFLSRQEFCPRQHIFSLHCI